MWKVSAATEICCSSKDPDAVTFRGHTGCGLVLLVSMQDFQWGTGRTAFSVFSSSVKRGFCPGFNTAQNQEGQTHIFLACCHRLGAQIFVPLGKLKFPMVQSLQISYSGVLCLQLLQPTFPIIPPAPQPGLSLIKVFLVLHKWTGVGPLGKESENAADLLCTALSDSFRLRANPHGFLFPLHSQQ